MSISSSRVSSLDDDPSLVVQVWMISRALLAIVVGVVMWHDHSSFAQVIMHWDVSFFFAIAARGYADPLTMAFFPGLPAMLHGGSLLGLPMEISGVLLGLAGSALAAWALYRLGGAAAASLWLIAPTAVFTALPYTESLFCAAAFWAWERARKDHWAAAGVCAAAACTLRVSGLFLIGALAVMAITEPLVPKSRDTMVNRLTRSGWLLLPVAVLASYAWYLHGLTGSWMAWMNAQAAGWNRDFTDPGTTFRHTVEALQPAMWPGRLEVPWIFRAEIVAMAVGVLTTVWCVAKRWWAEASWVGIQVVAFGTSYWYLSVNRAVLLWFPTFIALAMLAQWRPRSRSGTLVWRRLAAVAVVVDLVVMVIWAWLFCTGRWAS